MRFSIANQLFEQFPDYVVGGLVAIGLDNTRLNPQIEQRLQEAAQKLTNKFNSDTTLLSSHPTIALWRNNFKTLGIKPGEYLTSIEALARRILKGEKPPSINPAIDLANSVSLSYLLPLGGHDLDKLSGDFEVRFAREGDKFSPSETASEVVPVGEPIYVDASEVRTRRWVWRQGAKGRVDANSRNVFFPIDGWAGLNDEEVQQATTLLKTLLTDLLGATCHEFLVNKAKPSFEFDISVSNVKPITSPTIITNVKRDRDRIDELLKRGVADIVTRDELEAKLLSGKQLRVKLGIDPTGPNIHIGRSVAVQKLRDFQQLGHQIIMLFGTFTAQIGDASDKNSTRPMITPAQVEQNVATYKEQVSLILEADKVEWRFNTEWFNDMPFKEGIVLMSHFTIAQMIERESFSQRFHAGKPISLQEIIYPVLQGYDSVMLKSDVEVGGTDQLFNMMAGRTMQRLYNQPQQSILMNVMINGTDNQKMSTSIGNGIYLSEPPKDQYGKFLRTVDELIIPYFEVLTRVPLAEVQLMREAITNGANPVQYKKQLAHTLVEMYHDKAAADVAAEAFEREIVHKEIPAEIAEYLVPAGIESMDIRDLLVEAKLATSKKEAARFVEQGGISIEGEKISDPKAKISLSDGMVVKRGNRHYARVKISGY